MPKPTYEDYDDEEYRPWKPDGDRIFRPRPTDEEIWKPDRPWHRDPWDPWDGLWPPPEGRW